MFDKSETIPVTYGYVRFLINSFNIKLIIELEMQHNRYYYAYARFNKFYLIWIFKFSIMLQKVGQNIICVLWTLYNITIAIHMVVSHIKIYQPHTLMFWAIFYDLISDNGSTMMNV